MQKLVAAACDEGALYPVPLPGSMFPLIQGDMRLRLSYSIAPEFWLLNRRGDEPVLDIPLTLDPAQKSLEVYQ